jgi:hypothetical protein
MVHAVMKELRREAFGANFEGKSVVRRGHKPGRHERTKRQRNQQDADDKLAAALGCESGAHVLPEPVTRGTSLFQISAAVRIEIGGGAWQSAGHARASASLPRSTD